MLVHFSNENSVPWFSNNNAGVRVLFHGHVCSKKHTFFFLIIFDKAKFLGKMDFPHDLWISNAAYIITVMRFSCSYFCFGERRLVIMLKARCLSSSPIPKYRFWYSYFAVKNVQRWTRIWKKMLILSVKNELFKCELFVDLF